MSDLKTTAARLNPNNPNEMQFAGYWERMLAVYGRGTTPQEYDRISAERRRAATGKD